ncbi:MAG: hypothetical protein AAF945_19515 [Actinomycetota bacterium]
MRRRRRLTLLTAATATAVAVACSDSGDGGEDAVDVASLRLGDVTVVAGEIPAFEATVSPDGRSVAHVRRSSGEICVVAIDDDRPSGCVPFDGRLAVERSAWSADGGVMVGHSDFLLDFVDPDLVRVDLVEGTATVITDEGVDDVAVEGEGPGVEGLVDVSPAFTSGGDLLFLRRTRDESDFELRIVSADELAGAGELGTIEEVVEPIGDLDLPVDVLPLSALRPTGDGRWVVLGIDFEAFDDPELFVVDVAGDTVESFELRGGDRNASIQLVDASPTHALIADLTPLRFLDTSAADDVLTLLDLTTGDTDRVRLRLADALPLGAALSPDGSAIAVAVDGIGDDSEPELIVLPIDDAGAGDPISLGLPADLPPDQGLSGFGNTIALGWTDDDRLVLGVGGDSVATIELLTDN